MPLIIAADNLNILNPVVAKALDALDPRPLQELARRVEQAGANLIDINPGFLPPRRHDRMAFMVEAVQQVTTLPLILDSPDARVLARGLAVAHQPPILNACTLEADKIREILPLARRTRPTWCFCSWMPTPAPELRWKAKSPWPWNSGSRPWPPA